MSIRSYSRCFSNSQKIIFLGNMLFDLMGSAQSVLDEVDLDWEQRSNFVALFVDTRRLLEHIDFEIPETFNEQESDKFGQYLFDIDVLLDEILYMGILDEGL